jgi:hypothetical protein
MQVDTSFSKIDNKYIFANEFFSFEIFSIDGESKSDWTNLISGSIACVQGDNFIIQSDGKVVKFTHFLYEEDEGDLEHKMCFKICFENCKKALLDAYFYVKDDSPCLTGFLKPVRISESVAKFTGLVVDQLHSRVEITKRFCQYIKEKNLQNPADRRQILPDDELRTVLNYEGTPSPLTYFGMQNLLTKQLKL